MKLILGIVLIVMGGMGLVGSIVNGSLLSMNILSIIGFLACVALCFYFGVRLIKKSK